MGDVESKNLQDKLWARLWEVLGSGAFFMLIGGGLLLVAARSMGSVHAAFSFVLVVLGCAILLFGTGTQGVGEFTSPGSEATAFKYKVGIAGGAGVLALAIGLGMVKEQKNIRDVFQIEKRYVRVQLSPKPDQVSTFAGFVAEAHTTTGTPVPTIHPTDNLIELIIPYLENQARDDITVDVQLKNVGHNVALSASVPTIVHVNMSTGKLIDTTGSLDFPVYTAKSDETVLNMQSTVTAENQLIGVDNHQESATGRQPPSHLESPKVEVH